MLISQQIAMDENSIQMSAIDLPNIKNAVRHPDTKTFRLEILQATKIVVPIEVIDLALIVPIATSDKYWEKEEGEAAEQMLVKFRDFAKLPFNSVFLENNTGGFLVKKDPGDPDAWLVLLVLNMRNGKFEIPYAYFRVYMNQRTSDGFIHSETIPIGVFKDYNIPLETTVFSKRLTTLASQQIAETLLFMNVRNSVTHRYTPRKDELKKLPAHLRKFYTYRIIDIYRDRECYHNLAEVEEDSNKNHLKGQSMGRAHMVRGHFKNIRGNLYWWNAFMRNRRNITTVGVVETDYNLKTN